ncbi:MAG: ATP-binding protein [Corynebacterium sp.]|nr:ATP-binding protein [Corynebacterium sp.]
MVKLIVFAGLPGVGKTRLAKVVARRTQATYLRVDAIEEPFAVLGDLADRGYQAVANLAAENLALGNDVVVDLVNPLHITRKRFTDLAEEKGAELLQIECQLQDREEHYRRVTGRNRPPSWEEVCHCHYEPWVEALDGERLLVDTLDFDTALAQIMPPLQ